MGFPKPEKANTVLATPFITLAYFNGKVKLTDPEFSWSRS